MYQFPRRIRYLLRVGFILISLFAAWFTCSFTGKPFLAQWGVFLLGVVVYEALILPVLLVLADEWLKGR